MSESRSSPPSRSLLRPAQAGVMLLEVMIAIIIFSVGVLSLMKLQSASVQQSTAAEFRATAALLAGDLVSRMWGTDRSKATLERLYGTQSGSGYQDWFKTVQASRLPNVDDANHRPTVSLAEAPGLSDATEVTITMSWQAPGEGSQKGADRHRYVTVVVIR